MNCKKIQSVSRRAVDDNIELLHDRAKYMNDFSSLRSVEPGLCLIFTGRSSSPGFELLDLIAKTYEIRFHKGCHTLSPTKSRSRCLCDLVKMP